MNMLSTLAAGAADRNFRFDLPGTVPDIVFCDGTCTNAKELDVNSGGGKWMYDQTATSFGFDPKTARKNPEQDAKVMVRMGDTINQMIADVKNGGAKSSTEWHSNFRSHLTQITRSEDAKIIANLNQQQLAKIAALPGAANLADPAIRGAVYSAVSAEGRLLSASAPQLGQAVQAGRALGTVATLALAEALSPEIPLAPQGTAAKSDNDTKRTPLNPAVAVLDTNNDDRLECKEIGKWVADTGSHSPNSRAYQDYVSGRAGTEFVVSVTFKAKDVKFDGCKDEAGGPLLLEAKGDHGGVLAPMGFGSAFDSVREQGRNQNLAATELGVQNEWHVQTEKDAQVINDVFSKAGITTPVIHDPLPVIK